MERVERQGHRLVVAGEELRFLLVNAYYLADEVGQGSPAHALEALDAAVRLGAKVVRTWGFNDAPWKASRMYDGLDEPNEIGLRALDWVVAEATRRRLRLIVTLMDYWPWYGGIAQWLKWSGAELADGDRDAPAGYAQRFYDDPGLREIYRRRVRRLLQRRNLFTGRFYGEEPAILAWELLNEARAAPLEWIRHAAGAVRADARQLIGLGDEEATFSEDLDLQSLHVYPEKGGALVGEELEWGHKTIVAARARANRPLVVGEFGLRRDRLDLARRQAAYRDWFATAIGLGVVGMGPWLLGYRARPAAWDEELTFYAEGDYDELLRAAAAGFAGARS